MMKFYDTLMTIEEFDERIEFLRTTDFNFFMEADPDTILEYFKDVSGYAEATKLAQAVEHKMGNLVLCRERSYDYQRFMTILDVLEDLAEYMNEAGAPFNFWQHMVDAFEDVGFVRAHEVDSRHLIEMLMFDPYRAEYIHDIKIDYNYAAIKEDHKWIREELQQYLFHPSRVEKWLNEGRELEDYLQ